MSILASAQKLARAAASNRSIPEGFDARAAIGVTRRPLQQQLVDEMRRFNVWVLHRRFGKTVEAIEQLVDRAWHCPVPDGRYAYIAPTYAQAEDIAWTYLNNFTENFPGRLVQQGRLAIYIPTLAGGRARVRLYGVDSPKQRLRGLYLDGCVLDEYADIPAPVWTQQVRPMLSDKERAVLDDLGRPNQWAVFLGTPRGRNHFYRLYENARLWMQGSPVIIRDPDTNKEVPEFRDDWAAALHRASETGVLSQSELRAALLDLQAHEGAEEGMAIYEQEYECSWDAAVRGSILAGILKELRERGHITEIPYNPHLPVHTCWDLGWDDATAIWFFQVFNGVPRFIDYYENSGADLRHYADKLAERGYRYGRHYFPHDVEVHELGTGKTRQKILNELGIRVRVTPKHAKWDGIAATKRWILQGYFDATRCAEGLDRLALYRREWDERNQVYRQEPVHDWASHAADALRIGAIGVSHVDRLGQDGEGRPDSRTTRAAEM